MTQAKAQQNVTDLVRTLQMLGKSPMLAEDVKAACTEAASLTWCLARLLKLDSLSQPKGATATVEDIYNAVEKLVEQEK